jgi:hypothetical protein
VEGRRMLKSKFRRHRKRKKTSIIEQRQRCTRRRSPWRFIYCCECCSHPVFERHGADLEVQHVIGVTEHC